MIVKIVEFDGTDILIEVSCDHQLVEDYLDNYKNIAKNPTVNGFIGYLRDRGEIVESIEPYVLVF